MPAEEKGERRHHFRGKPRPGRRVDVTYRKEGDEPVRAQTRNIGIGGAFVVTKEPPPVGTALVLAIEVPTSETPIEVKAEVRWHAPDDAEEPGMGVKFYGLEVEELLQLNEYFASLIGKDEQ